MYLDNLKRYLRIKIAKIQLMRTKKTEYDIDIYNLLKEVQKRGVLVKIMEKNSSFLTEYFTCYKKNLGAIPIKNILGNIYSVYVVYEDFDGSIKYYDYPR